MAQWRRDPTSYPPEIRAKAVEMYRDGLTQKEIAKRLKLGDGAIHGIVKMEMDADEVHEIKSRNSLSFKESRGKKKAPMIRFGETFATAYLRAW